MRNDVVVVVLVILVVGSLGIGYFAGSSNRQTVTTTSTVFLSTTMTRTLTSNETALQSSASNSSWRFVVSINATAVESGQSILLWANLTNTSPSNETIRPFVQPYINPSVTGANGTVVWAWNPPEATWLNWNVTSGQSLLQDVVIPMTSLQNGVYGIQVAPLSSEFSENFNLTLHFSVVSLCGPFGCDISTTTVHSGQTP